MNTVRFASVLAALLTLGLGSSAAAQTSAQATASLRPSVSLSGGAFQYDLSGTGTAPMIAARAELPLSRHFLAEGGLTVARPEQQFGATTTFIVPEAQLQAQLPLADGRIAPYLGAGVGAAFDRRTRALGGTQTDLSVSGATGVRYWVTDQLGLRAELRARGIGTGFEGAAAEWTLGTSWRL